MNYFSLGNKKNTASFKEAVIAGIAPDKGLYFPESITPLPKHFFDSIEELHEQEIAFQAIHQFVKEALPDTVLKDILAEVLDFDFPVVEIEEDIATLELFHGPTMAFKDVGARFMARCLGYFSKNTPNEKVTVLVATSGDTGGAVANGFLGVAGVEVVILYPSGKVSTIQEKQLTTLGRNIRALEVDGTFDDCQKMVKQAFLDESITKYQKLTSANSINVARWLPQLLYFLFAFKQARNKKELVFSVPSGNFGNICAGMVAQRLGMPVTHFIAATNSNDTVPQFMETQHYAPKPSIATISNAMDVGDPSNFIRIRQLYDNNFERLSKNISSFSFDEESTKNAMKAIYKKTGYILDPHGAVGYLGLKKYRTEHPKASGIFLETAHPIKFLPVIQETLGISLEVPPQIEKVLHQEKRAVQISTYQELKEFLIA